MTFADDFAHAPAGQAATPPAVANRNLTAAELSPPAARRRVGAARRYLYVTSFASAYFFALRPTMEPAGTGLGGLLLAMDCAIIAAGALFSVWLRSRAV